MQAINRLLSQNCNCYPHLFRCSTIKIHNSFQLPLKPSVALLSSHFNTLFSFQGAISSFFEARSQNPISWVLRSNSKLDLVGPSGLEPPTLRLSVVRSSQLSYGPISTAQGLVPSKLNNEQSARCASHIAANAFAFAQTSDQDVRQYLFRLLVELYVALRAPCNSGRY